MSNFKIGDNVRFKAGPKSFGLTDATVTHMAIDGFLTTKDVSGKVRKVRPGNCTKI